MPRWREKPVGADGHDRQSAFGLFAHGQQRWCAGQALSRDPRNERHVVALVNDRLGRWGGPHHDFPVRRKIPRHRRFPAGRAVGQQSQDAVDAAVEWFDNVAAPGEPATHDILHDVAAGTVLQHLPARPGAGGGQPFACGHPILIARIGIGTARHHPAAFSKEFLQHLEIGRRERGHHHDIVFAAGEAFRQIFFRAMVQLNAQRVERTHDIFIVQATTKQDSRLDRFGLCHRHPNPQTNSQTDNPLHPVLQLVNRALLR